MAQRLFVHCSKPLGKLRLFGRFDDELGTHPGVIRWPQPFRRFAGLVGAKERSTLRPDITKGED
jgi:hypothetical protein